MPFAPAIVLAIVGLVFILAGSGRGLDLPPGRGSELVLEAVATIAAVLFSLVGLLIARKETANPIGWIFLWSAAALGLMDAAHGYADLALYGRTNWPGGPWAGWLTSWLVIVLFVAPCLIAQLFPDGRPPSPRWGRVLRLSVGLGFYLALSPALQPRRLGSYPDVANPLGTPHWAGNVLVDPVWGVAVLLLLGLSLTSIVTRFRRSTGVERKQLTWLALAGALVIVAFIGAFVANGIGGVIETVFFAVGFSAFLVMPVAVAVAILRYRLYEIDRIISRTLVYGGLTVVLGAAYVGLVLGGQAVFSSFAGGGGLVIAVSTLVVAALFLPMRSRVQRLVDRRFYRRRYDAQRTLESFGTRLREQVDLETLQVELQNVVHETVQPAGVALWLRTRERSS